MIADIRPSPLRSQMSVMPVAQQRRHVVYTPCTCANAAVALGVCKTWLAGAFDASGTDAAGSVLRIAASQDAVETVGCVCTSMPAW